LRNSSGELIDSTFTDETSLEPLRSLAFTHGGLGDMNTHPPRLLGNDWYRVALVNRSPPSRDMLFVLYPVSHLRAARIQAAYPPLLLGVVALIGVVLISSIVFRRLARRLEDVRNQVADIAAGNFREIPLSDPPDEIQDLISSVNAMSRQLKAMQQLIGRTERSRVLGQLAGGLAHQLRNALTGTRLAIQIHMRRCSHSAQDESLKVALQQLSVMEEHVRRLLSVGRGEKIEVGWCSINKLFEEVRTLVAPVCKHSRVEFDLTIPPLTILEVRGHYEGLRNALLNLVLNSVEAAGPDGKIAIRAHLDQADLIVEVFDNGLGPPPEIAPQLFEPFVTGKPDGVGLGLVVVQQVVRQHQGEVTWERIGEETCFRMRLPQIPARFLTRDQLRQTAPLPGIGSERPLPVAQTPSGV
ncbi:MAG: HAMP domain-containing sensor histidine kinase, partial [Planctomycetales bacterium]